MLYILVVQFFFIFNPVKNKGSPVSSKYGNGVMFEVQLYGYRPGSNVHNNRGREGTNGNSLFVWTCIVLFRGHTVLWAKQ